MARRSSSRSSSRRSRRSFGKQTKLNRRVKRVTGKSVTPRRAPKRKAAQKKPLLAQWNRRSKSGKVTVVHRHKFFR